VAVQDVAQQAVDHTPAWLTFIGALLVAVLAAGTAQWRQHVQLRHDRELKQIELDHENERLRTQLAHDGDRQQAQLAHDRELADLAELREVLDEAAAMTWNAMNRLADAWQAADEWAAFPEGGEDKAAVNTAREHRHAAFEAIWPMEGMLGRLALRIGDHAVTRAFSDYHQAAKAAARAVPPTRPDEARLTVWRSEHAPQLRASRQAFVDGGLRLVGSRLSDD
jgi:hypothetical protein